MWHQSHFHQLMTLSRQLHSETQRKRRVAGLADNSVTLEFHQDYATSSIEQTIYPTLGTAVTIAVKPVNATTTTINPQYAFSAVDLRVDSGEWCCGRVSNGKCVLADLRRNYKNNNLIELGGK
jgi:hypothetical protein